MMCMNVIFLENLANACQRFLIHDCPRWWQLILGVAVSTMSPQCLIFQEFLTTHRTLVVPFLMNGLVFPQGFHVFECIRTNFTNKVSGFQMCCHVIFETSSERESLSANFATVRFLARMNDAMLLQLRVCHKLFLANVALVPVIEGVEADFVRATSSLVFEYLRTIPAVVREILMFEFHVAREDVF